MFINLSNHPSDKWTERQREAALGMQVSRRLGLHAHMRALMLAG